MLHLPPLPETFRWTKETWGAGLRCRALEPIAPHLFTSRQPDLSSDAALRALAEAVGAERVAMLTQVHGGAVAVVRRDGPGVAGRPEADALVSNDPRTALVVRAADCVPLLLADRDTGAVGAVHAGWRGTAARVAPLALEAMGREFGTAPGNVIAAIGPSIGPCCYEVGPELVDAFAAAGHERYLIARWFVTPPPPRGAFPGSPGSADPRLRLDVAGANRDQLILAGVPEDQIHVSGLCTAMHLDVFTSFRAEKEKAGRLAGVIRARR